MAHARAAKDKDARMLSKGKSRGHRWFAVTPDGLTRTKLREFYTTTSCEAIKGPLGIYGFAGIQSIYSAVS